MAYTQNTFDQYRESLQIEENLNERFDPTKIGKLCLKYIEEGAGFDVRRALDGRQFLVAYIDANSEYGDIPRSVETNVFSRSFKLPKHQVMEDYGKYDESSTFATVIDAQAIKPAGALRIIEYKEGLGFKDVNDLVEDDQYNPWLGEIKQGYFDRDEIYTEDEAWKRLGQKENDILVLEDSLDIATHASEIGYDGQNGAISGTSMLFYHACLRYALEAKKDNLLAIFDIPPFNNLQQFGKPFDTYSLLNPHPYGGPYDTVPAYCVLDRGIGRIYSFDTNIGDVFLKGTSLDAIGLLPNEYMSDKYSNDAIGV